MAKLNPFAKKASTGGRRRPNSDLAPPPASFAYSSQRAEANPAPVGKRSAKGWLRRLGLRLLYVAIFLLAINLLSLSPKAKVLPLNNQGQTLLRDNSIYQNVADQFLADSLWNRSKLTINTVKLKLQMQDRFPELAGVNVTLPLLSHEPVVYIEPAKPVLVLTADNGALVIAANGKVILRTDADSPAIKRLNLPRLEDQSGFNVQANRQVLPASQVGFIQNILTQLQAKQYTVSGMTLPPASSELDVQLTGQPYIIKFNLNSDNPRGQAGTFMATINTLKHQNITPAKYVDVRIPGRAYYQ
jgi:hypothetical protein